MKKKKRRGERNRSSCVGLKKGVKEGEGVCCLEWTLRHLSMSSADMEQVMKANGLSSEQGNGSNAAEQAQLQKEQQEYVFHFLKMRQVNH